MSIRIKRVYEKTAPADGYRVLVDRLWPRGVSKEDAALDLWLKEIAPSSELRVEFNHRPERFDEFRRHYRAELDDNPAVGQLREIEAAHPVVTLLYGARDTAVNHAVVLAEYLGGLSRRTGIHIAASWAVLHRLPISPHPRLLLLHAGSMNHVVKAHSPADILAMVPSLVGFVPRNSLVLIAFRGNRTCGAIRFDLPKVKSEVVHKRFATFVLGTLCKLRNIDAVIPVIRTDVGFAGEVAPPDAALAGVLARRIRQLGFELRDLLCHAGDGWASYLDPDSPAGGHPITQITESPVTGEIPAGLRGGPDATEAPRRVPDAPEAERRRVRDALAHYRGLMRAAKEGEPDAVNDPIEFESLDDLPLFIEQALFWDDATIAQNDALLLFMTQGPAMRDLTMLQWASDLVTGDLFMDELERMNGAGGPDPEAPRDVPEMMSDLMFGIGPRPEPQRIVRGIALMLTVISRADDAERPAPLCMLAWLSWALGHGTEAGRYIDEAISIDPEYSMAGLLEGIFSSGRLPEWAFVEA